MSSLEAMRRELRETQPELYAYVAASEAAHALEAAAESLTGATTAAQAALRLTRLASRLNERKNRVAAEWKEQ